MGGSLRNPAGFCGVVGLRPSPGRVPTWPTRHPWGTLSVDGPMARTVADVALFLSVLAGPDPRCPIAIDRARRRCSPRRCPRDATCGACGWPGAPDWAGCRSSPTCSPCWTAPAGRSRRLGCGVEEADPPLDGADEAFEILRAHQFELGWGEQFDRAGERMKATVRWNIEAGRALTGADVGRAERRRGEVFAAMAVFFERFDVVAGPVSQVAPFPLDVEYPTAVEGRPMGTYIEWMRSCSRLTVTACPALSVPAGFTAGGLPVGLQLVGRYRGERRLLEIGHAVEAALGAADRRPPVVTAAASPRRPPLTRQATAHTAGHRRQRGAPAGLAYGVLVEPVGEVGERQAGGRVGPGQLPAGPRVAEGAGRHGAAQTPDVGPVVVTGQDQPEGPVGRRAHQRVGQRVAHVAGGVGQQLGRPQSGRVCRAAAGRRARAGRLAGSRPRRARPPPGCPAR